jgi:large subunit ribosomal protein L3
MNSFYTTKIDQTHTYDKNGKRLFITRLKAQPLTITQVKSQEKDRYLSLQVAIGQKKRITKPQLGHLKNLDIKPLFLREIKLADNTDKKVGETVSMGEIFEIGDFVLVTGKSKGRGFAGVMKRWNFHGGVATHGQTDRERAPGSIGQGTTPGRVHKGKKMPGRMGNVIATRKGARIIKVDQQNQEIWITGSAPGPRGNLIKLEKYHHKDFVGLLPTRNASHSDAGGENKPEKTKKETKVEKTEESKKPEVKSEPTQKETPKPETKEIKK